MGESSGDRMGDTIAMNGAGTIVAVASPFDDAINGRDSGSIRIYEVINAVWTQIGSTIVGDNVDDRWGFSMAMNEAGTVLAVGTPFHSISTSLNDVGLVKVYRFTGGDWAQIGSSIEGADEQELGFSVSLSNDGTMLAVGLPGADGLEPDGSDSTQSGFVNVYQNQNDAWVLVVEIQGEQEGDRAGTTVVLNGDGTTVAMASEEHNPDATGADTGYIVLHNCGNDGVWSKIGEKILGLVRGDRFGTAVALSEDGNIVAGGAPSADPNDSSSSGQVRIFELQNGVWTQLGNSIDGEDQSDDSGEWIDMTADGSMIAIAAIRNDAEETGSVGHVRTFRNDGGTWTQVGTDVDGLDRLEDFGRSVKLSRDGRIMAAGAPRADNAGTSSGEARIFELI